MTEANTFFMEVAEKDLRAFNGSKDRKKVRELTKKAQSYLQAITNSHYPVFNKEGVLEAKCLKYTNEATYFKPLNDKSSKWKEWVVEIEKDIKRLGRE